MGRSAGMFEALKGGGEATVHSKVVAPSPHWLAGTVALRLSE